MPNANPDGYQQTHLRQIQTIYVVEKLTTYRGGEERPRRLLMKYQRTSWDIVRYS